MSKARIFSSIIVFCVTLPIWFYVLYQILDAINASELTWFLFWIYWPAQLLGVICSQIASSNGE